jgi:hypothetical protein
MASDGDESVIYRKNVKKNILKIYRNYKWNFPLDSHFPLKRAKLNLRSKFFDIIPQQ